MPPPVQTGRLDTIPVLPPLSFQRPLVSDSPRAPMARPRPLPRDVVVSTEPSLLMQTMPPKSSSPPTPELLRSRSSTNSSRSSRPPTPGRASIDAPEQSSASPNVNASQPVNALGLSQRRRFKSEPLDLKVKKSTPNPSTLSLRGAFLSPFLSPSLTPRTSLFERMTSIINRSPSPSPSFSVDHPEPMTVSAKVAAVRKLIYTEGPFASRRSESDPPVFTFWSEESESSFIGGDVYDFEAYVEPGPQRTTSTKDPKRYRSIRWPPARPQTLVHQCSIPDRCDTFDRKRPDPYDHSKIREQKRERRTTQIHSAQLFTASSTSTLPYVRGGPPSGGYLQEFPLEIQSRLLSADMLSQKPSVEPVPTEMNQARQIGELIDLMAEGADISGISGDSVYLRGSLSDILYAL